MRRIRALAILCFILLLFAFCSKGHESHESSSFSLKSLFRTLFFSSSSHSSSSPPPSIFTNKETYRIYLAPPFPPDSQHHHTSIFPEEGCSKTEMSGHGSESLILHLFKQIEWKGKGGGGEEEGFPFRFGTSKVVVVSSPELADIVLIQHSLKETLGKMKEKGEKGRKILVQDFIQHLKRIPSKCGGCEFVMVFGSGGSLGYQEITSRENFPHLISIGVDEGKLTLKGFSSFLFFSFLFFSFLFFAFLFLSSLLLSLSFPFLSSPPSSFLLPPPPPPPLLPRISFQAKNPTSVGISITMEMTLTASPSPFLIPSLLATSLLLSLQNLLLSLLLPLLLLLLLLRTLLFPPFPPVPIFFFIILTEKLEEKIIFVIPWLLLSPPKPNNTKKKKLFLFDMTKQNYYPWTKIIHIFLQTQHFVCVLKVLLLLREE